MLDFDDISYDQAKSDKNFRDRGFDYDYAALGLSNILFESLDERFDYGEIRRQAICTIDGNLYFVVYTPRPYGPHHLCISLHRTEDAQAYLQISLHSFRQGAFP